MPTTQMPIDGVFDTTTGQLVGIVAPSGPELSLAPGTKKSRSLKKQLVGRMKTVANAAVHTTQLQMELEAPFYAVRIGIPNLHTGTISGVKVSAAPQTTAFAVGNTGNNATSGGWVNATFAGSSTVTLPARVAVERPSWTWTDWIYISSVARADGGVRPLLVVRVEIPSTDGFITVPFDGLQNWQDGVSNAGRLFRRSSQAEDGVTTPADFTTVAMNNTNFVPLAVEYSLSNGTGRQYLLSGDSTVEGRGDAGLYGHAQRAILESSTISSPSDYFNAALHAQSAAVYTEYLNDIIGMVSPGLLVLSPYTVNSFSTTISNGTMQQYRGTCGRALALADQQNATVILLTGNPCSTTFKTVVGDNLRRTFNTELLANVAARTVTADVAGAVAGAINGSDQQELAAGVSDDGVHMNNTGYELQKTVMARAIGSLPA